MAIHFLWNTVYTGWPKKVSHYQIIKKIVLNRIKACQWDIRQIDKSSTIILFDDIRYSVRDLLSDFNNYAWPAN